MKNCWEAEKWHGKTRRKRVSTSKRMAWTAKSTNYGEERNPKEGMHQKRIQCRMEKQKAGSSARARYHGQQSARSAEKLQKETEGTFLEIMFRPAHVPGQRSWWRQSFILKHWWLQATQIYKEFWRKQCLAFEKKEWERGTQSVEGGEQAQGHGAWQKLWNSMNLIHVLHKGSWTLSERYIFEKRCWMPFWRMKRLKCYKEKPKPEEVSSATM